MPYEKKNNPHYQNLGGINSKVSPYLTDQVEFLKLENIDFQQPGSLTKRWGSTQYFGQSLGVSNKIDGLYEFTRQSGASFFYASAGGTIGIARPDGFSSIYSGSTSGVSYFISFGSSNIDRWLLGASLNQDYDVSQDQAFLANKKSFLKSSNGFSFLFFGLPRPQFTGAAALGDGLEGGTNNPGGFTGMYFYKFAWVNSYGMAGAPTQALAGLTPGGFNYYQTSRIVSGSTKIAFSVTAGGTAISGGVAGRIVPPNFDITGLALFRAGPFEINPGGTGFTNPLLAPTSPVVLDQLGGFTAYYCAIENEDFFYIQTQGVSTGSQACTFIDTNVTGGITLLNKNIMPWNWYNFFEGTGSPIGSTAGNAFGLTFPVGYGITLVPNALELYSNRLFVCGMSYAPSTAWFSAFNEPEHFEADFNFDVRSNDGEPVVAMKSYNGALLFFKPSSFFVLTGDDPSTFNLTQVSNEYGCLGNRAVAQYENYLVFLDKKGIILYNGANIDIVSTKIDPIFARLNVNACRENACITYDKQRNQLLIDVPVDGSTVNNLTIVYDIISKAWTTYSGYRPAVTAVASGGISGSVGRDAIYFGGYSGLVSYFGQSFLSDNGTAYTTIIKSGFLSDMGNSVTKLFRRLFTDTIPQGSSSAIDVNFYQDYGSSIVLTIPIQQTPFQSRIEFGIPAKSLSVEYVMGSTYALTLHGWVLQDRFLRPF